MAYWLAIGPVGNWEIGVKEKVWAVSPAHNKTWKRLRPGDTVFFYATAPVKGIIGLGTVREKRFDEELFWPQEREKGQSLWPFRLRFGDLKVLPKKEWSTKRYEPDRQGIVFQRAFQPVKPEVAEDWLSHLDD